MTNSIKVAVIGVGRWGVHLLRNFLAHPQVEVVAVVDPNPECLAKVERQYKFTEDVLLTTEWQKLQQLPDLNAVVIATPAVTHYSLIVDALNWGCHVLSEKPLTLNPSECYELCKLAEKQQQILMVDHTYLFHPAVEKGQALLQSGAVGDLRYGYATRTHLGPVRQDVDALWDLAIHDIAIFNNWLGESPIFAQATGKAWLQTAENKSSSSNPLSDLVQVNLTYPSGFQAFIHLCWLNPDKQRRLAVVGNRGSLIFDEMLSEAPLMLMEGEFERQENRFIPVNQQRKVIEIEKGEPLKKVCDGFIECIVQNTPSSISNGRVGAELVEILTALTQSLEAGGKTISVARQN
ncbi:oxidoreductase domain-containing protein [Calothrix parasitica NIES-267]|uniref:Oxidoreductase domain-containing protein n=1 Tax=Calothrix parasitica NIES-267 TaxID=1973488 RepID=A0A1Z4LQ24_9CYAN|nr:oxidoreductase domain-containing protein [Calothrix parasitica NIES-267]